MYMYIHVHINIHMYIYIHTYVCMCIYVIMYICAMQDVVSVSIVQRMTWPATKLFWSAEGSDPKGFQISPRLVARGRTNTPPIQGHAAATSKGISSTKCGVS